MPRVLTPKLKHKIPKKCYKVDKKDFHGPIRILPTSAYINPKRRLFVFKSSQDFLSFDVGMNYYQFDPTRMNNSENVQSYVQNENFTPVSQPSYLTRDQEHEIIVSTLRQVISSPGGDTSSSYWIASEVLPPPDAGPCPICGVTGCYGCAFPRPVEIKKEKKHKGVRKKPSGKLYFNIMFQHLIICSPNLCIIFSLTIR